MSLWSLHGDHFWIMRGGGETGSFIFDELMEFTWWPLLDKERWKDDWQLHWVGVDMWLFGQSIYVMEYYAPYRVARQFGHVLDIVRDIPLYPKTTWEVGRWG